MEIVNDINGLDFDDPIEDQPIEQPNDPNQVDDQNNAADSPPQYAETDIIKSLLKDRGISDPSKIKFEQEDGTLVDRSWSDLSLDEQREILNQSPQSDPDVDLDNDEIEMINQMRLSNMSPEQYIESIKQQGAKQYADQLNSQPQSYQVDDISDDELYILDLQYKSPNISIEEAEQQLNAVKQNETLFNKTVQGLREYYKKLETEANEQKELEAQSRQQQEFQQFSNAIQSSIDSINQIGNLDLNMNNDDREQLAQFILGQDQAGVNWFSKALEDPDTVVRMAWFALNGEEAFNDIENYLSQQINAAYNKGLKDGQQKSGTVVINKSNATSQQPLSAFNKQQTIDINQLDF